MASGQKLPKTNLNLIQDTDMIDYADINAIAQAVETNATYIDSRFPVGNIPNGTDLHTLSTGAYSLGGTGEYTNGIANMYGWLEVKEVGGRKYMTFHKFDNTIHVMVVGSAASGEWKEL